MSGPSAAASRPAACLSPHAGCLFSDTLLKSNTRLPRLLLILIFDEWWPSADIISISKFSPSVSQRLKWCLHRLHVISVIWGYIFCTFQRYILCFRDIARRHIAILQVHVARRTWKSLFEYTFIVIRTLSTHYKQSALNLICRNWHFRAIRRPYSFWVRHRCRKYKPQIYNNLSDVL